MEKQYVFKTEHLVEYRFPTHVNAIILDRQDAATSEAFMVRIEPDKSSPLHVHHDTEQVFYVTSGKGILRINGDETSTMNIFPGDVVRIPPGILHSVAASGDEVLIYLCVDCFLQGRPVSEPTWESHVRVVCRNFGWDFDRVRFNSQ